MPASCANALRPTTALLGGGKTPVRCDSSWLVRKISRVLTLVRNETDRGRTRPAITTSSSEALPARSPMPFTVHSTWVAPASTAASEFATASPRSSWQWQLRATRRACGAAHLLRHGAHAAEVPVRRRGEPRLDHVHSERVQLAREAELLLRGHRVARGLLSVAQRGVEDPHDVLFHGGSSWVKQSAANLWGPRRWLDSDDYSIAYSIATLARAADPSWAVMLSSRTSRRTTSTS